MLVLTRKCGEKVCIDANISVVVLEVSGNRVRIGIDAPRQVNIVRAELCEPPAPRIVHAQCKTLNSADSPPPGS